MLQIAVTCFHSFFVVREEQYALIRRHGIHPPLFTGQSFIVPAFSLVMPDKLFILLVFCSAVDDARRLNSFNPVFSV